MKSESQKIMKKYGQSFYWATWLLSDESAKDIAIIYAFCRYIDDLIDDKQIHPLEVQSQIKAIKKEIENNKSELEVVDLFLKVVEKKAMSTLPAQILIDTLSKDLYPVRIQTWDELIKYCYGAASTVGLMMCDVMQVCNPQAYHYAIDLGIAMQLTNIARDVYEDAMHDKIYLPMDEFNSIVTPSDILSLPLQSTIIQIRDKLLNQADIYYESAKKGMKYLPKRARLAIIVASKLYQAKGTIIKKDSKRYLYERANTSLLKKIMYTVQSVYLFVRSVVNKTLNLHESTLHSYLQGLPGANETQMQM